MSYYQGLVNTIGCAWSDLLHVLLVLVVSHCEGACVPRRAAMELHPLDSIRRKISLCVHNIDLHKYERTSVLKNYAHNVPQGCPTCSKVLITYEIHVDPTTYAHSLLVLYDKSNRKNVILRVLQP